MLQPLTTASCKFLRQSSISIRQPASISAGRRSMWCVGDKNTLNLHALLFFPGRFQLSVCPVSTAKPTAVLFPSFCRRHAVDGSCCTSTKSAKTEPASSRTMCGVDLKPAETACGQANRNRTQTTHLHTAHIPTASSRGGGCRAS